MHTNKAAIINIPVITPIELITNPKRELSILEFFLVVKHRFFVFRCKITALNSQNAGVRKKKCIL